MSTIVRTTAVLLLAFAVSAPGSGSAQSGARPAGSSAVTPAAATAAIVSAARALVATLDEAGRAKVQFPFDGPQKTRWSNLPTGIFERQGLRMGDLTPPQRA